MLGTKSPLKAKWAMWKTLSIYVYLWSNNSQRKVIPCNIYLFYQLSYIWKVFGTLF